MHVLAVSGTNPTLDMIIQSDNVSGFTSPTTKITFDQAVAVGAQWGTRVAGPLTDDYYRASWTNRRDRYAIVHGIRRRGDFIRRR